VSLYKPLPLRIITQYPTPPPFFSHTRTCTHTHTHTHTQVIDATQMANLKHLPESLAVIGGGVISVEYATVGVHSG
jgi:pyruvate/2-oxoglutarate dehydrogenase complex dihydrolipoamide dehydrogenase (E3) component